MLASLTTLPSFLAYLAIALAALLVFLRLYTWVTPHSEWQLIRQGNVAAAWALAGATVGFSLPLASVVLNAVDYFDLIVWAAIALIVQLGAYLAVRLILAREIKRDIEENWVGVGVLLGSVSLAVGVLNAACLSYEP
jgi:putative membrane protein